MKIFFSIISFLLVSFSISAKLSLEGNYQGKNLFVQNPTSEDGFGFCVNKVTVNGNVLPGGTNKSAFEIDFSFFDLEIGDKVFIEIEHEAGCMPKVLNPEVLLPKSTFKVTELSAKKDGTVSWVTEGENGQLPFVIEQFRWNKWVNVGEVNGLGTGGPNSYSFKIDPNSGLNKIRIIQSDNTGEKRISDETTFVSNMPEIVMYPTKVKTDIFFTADDESIETRYEIYDAYGNIVKKGFSSMVDCKNLKKGAYYINFDNKTEKFIKS